MMTSAAYKSAGMGGRYAEGRGFGLVVFAAEAGRQAKCLAGEAKGALTVARRCSGAVRRRERRKKYDKTRKEMPWLT